MPVWRNPDDESRLTPEDLSAQEKLLSAFFKSGGSVKSAAKKAGMTPYKAKRILADPKSPAHEAGVQILASADVTNEKIIELLAKEATYPHEGDPQHRSVNVRAMEILAKMIGAFDLRGRNKVDAAKSISDAMEKIWAGRGVIIDVESTPVNKPSEGNS